MCSLCCISGPVIPKITIRGNQGGDGLSPISEDKARSNSVRLLGDKKDDSGQRPA